MLKILFVSVVLARLSSANNVIQLNEDNIDEVFKKNELVFVNFYADWCRFSNMLTPVFADGSDKVAEKYPVDSGVVVFARVDCDKQTSLASKFKITKYPTLKMFRFGEAMKKEYRGQRSADAFLKYIDDQLISPVIKQPTHEAMQAISDKNRNMLAYVKDENSNHYKNVLRAASQMRTECHWYILTGPAAEPHLKNGEDVVYFRQPLTLANSDIPFTGLTKAETLTQWAKELCVPVVRELTFENAEELTEEGLPFLVLFHHPDDKQTPAQYLEQVNLQLSNDRDSVTPLTADGLKFAHPLQHLGKNANDLPLIAIDSFKHMYLWKHDVKTQLGTDGLLKQFVDDLGSGKLHREFHYGPDPVVQVAGQPPKPNQPTQTGQAAPGKQPAPSAPPVKQETQPPESVFKQLKPSSNRYTVLKDEL